MSHPMPIEPAVREQMRAFGKALEACLPPGYGFVFLTFKSGEGGRMNYISNAKREDVVVALKELVANFEGRVMETPGRKQ